jgi:hypothetical protein
MQIKLNWSNLKNKNLTLSYVTANGNYYIYAYNSGVEYIVIMDINSEDAEDFNTNYKDTALNLI